MGTSDFVTGLAFGEREPAVAVIIGRRTGGHPDAEKAAAIPGIDANHIFEPLSLPVRGSAGAYGGFEPLPGQVSVALACEMTGAPSWAAFAEQALDFRIGTRIRTDIRAARSMVGAGAEPVPSNTRVLGLAVMSEATWGLVTSLNGTHAGREPDVALVRKAILDARKRCDVAAAARAAGAPEDRETSRLIYRAISLEWLALSGTWTFGDGTEHELPRLARSLSDMDPGVGSEFRAWLRDNLGSGKRFEEILEGLWDLDAMLLGLRDLNRMLLPSSSGGRYVNAEEVIALSLSSIEEAAARMIAKVEDYEGADAGPKLEAALAQADALLERLATRLAEARGASAPGTRR